ncbi:hypothetical protein MPS_0474 [Mycobacterium pseudoshottsii JCM 15466]|nr:hypothetical protein MPS_0474 [Mycobacterium pseudoshottsii JCM 15466]
MSRQLANRNPPAAPKCKPRGELLAVVAMASVNLLIFLPLPILTD